MKKKTLLISLSLLLAVFVFIICGNSCKIVEMLDVVIKKTIELEVMTYNIYHADPSGPAERQWRNRKAQIVAHINLFEPDVLGVQEAGRGQIDYLLDELPEYGFYGVGRDDGDTQGEHAGIFFLRERFHVDDSGTFWFSDTPWRASIGGSNWGNPSHKRICSWVRLIETETDKAFYFYNLHLEHGSDGATARQKSVELLGDKIDARVHQENLFIVVGDFNAKPTDDSIQYVVNDLGYLDTYAETNENLDEGYTFVGWSRDQRKRIDYIFTHPNALLTDSSVIRRSYSDHYPLLTKLLLPKEISEGPSCSRR